VPDNVPNGKAIQVSLNIVDIWSESYTAKKSSDGGDAYLAERHGKWLDNLEASVKGKYFFGDKISFVDFQALNLFNVLEFIYGDKNAKQVATRPKLTAWLHEMNSLASVKKVLANNPPVLYPGVKATGNI